MNDIIEFTEKIFNVSIKDIFKKNILIKSTTTPSFDEKNNYELLELLGDKVLQEYFVMYCIEILRFDNHINSENIITRLIIRHLSGKNVAKFSKLVGLDNFIRSKEICTDEILGDIFESWVGACRFIFDDQCVRKLLYSIFTTIPIKIGYDDLYDQKTILNDLMSTVKGRVINMGVVKELDTETEDFYFESRLEFEKTNSPRIIGVGRSTDRKEAEQEAAKNLISNFQNSVGNEMYEKFMFDIKNYSKWKSFYDSFSKNEIKRNCRKKYLFTNINK